ncbi:MAG: DUF3155 domain-containing protein [Gemmatimonadaceae bacterium]|nr:DUF3155 domain-containing protein [Gloeobacterales cyanobacterium ES-bin-141]
MAGDTHLTRRKRRNPRRLEGKRILELVPQFHLDCGPEKSVTAARKFIECSRISPPAMLVVQRNEHTQDRYFWGLKGLFSAQYVEDNHFMFPSLEVLRTQFESDSQDDSVA